jgi:hypothetical protein
MPDLGLLEAVVVVDEPVLVRHLSGDDRGAGAEGPAGGVKQLAKRVPVRARASRSGVVARR